MDNETNGGGVTIESTHLLDSIMDAIRNTPQKRHEHFCHGDYHCDYHTDYDAIRTKIEALLSNVKGETQT